MNIILIFSGFIIALVLLYEYRIRLIYKGRNKNKVHFYVTRDKHGGLWLYLGKPERWCNRFSNFYGTCRNFIASEYYFKDVGLNPNNFKDLKWEDEPIEVFVNMED